MPTLPDNAVPIDGNGKPAAALVGYDGTDWQLADVDSDHGSIKARNLIWNTNTLAWEAATGSLSGGSNVTVANFPATQPISSTQLPSALTGAGYLKVSIEADNAGGSAASAILLDEATADVTYIGTAAVGSAAGDAAWSIKKLDQASGLSITWADGTSASTKTWNDRASYTYS